jgi:predicted ATPase
VGEEGYVGPDVHRAARIAAAGHGGQVLVSAASAQLVEMELNDLGEHRLKDLSAPERIYQLGDEDFPPLKSLYRTNLPIPATPFLGRERELHDVLSLLSEEGTRLLTLTGPGGTGKTRLALQAVATAADSYPDGVYWVPLAPLRDPELVLASASQAVGARNGVADHIADKRLLLLFDNFEQVAEAAPGLSDLLQACPNLDLVVTSREPLHLAGEHEYAVPSFVHEEGVGFFLARARAITPSFEPDDAVSEICRRLDDLPLALELAAARVKALTPAQILERLERSLPLLTGGSRDLPERQRTLRATIEWSYDLLAEDEQHLFAGLAVFRGGCTLEAAEGVADANVDLLHSLVGKSLLRFSSGRYWMLETIREYAGERFAAASAAAEMAQRHADYYVRLAQAAEPELTTPAQAAWLDRLEGEHDNLRATLDWSIETEQWEFGLRMAHSLRRFWQVRGHFQEARRYLARLTAADQPLELRALALPHLVFFTLQLNELDEAEQYAEECRRLCLAVGDDEGANRALQNLGGIAELRGNLDRATVVFEEVLATARALPTDLGIPLMSLATVRWKQGQLAEAEALYDEALAYFEEIGDDAEEAYVSTNLAAVRLYQGRRDDALSPLGRALALCQELRSLPGFAHAFDSTALAAVDAESAARLLGKADDLRAEIDERLPPAPHGPHARAVAIATDVLGQERFEAAYAEGRAMSLDGAIALAFEVIAQAPER